MNFRPHGHIQSNIGARVITLLLSVAKTTSIASSHVKWDHVVASSDDDDDDDDDEDDEDDDDGDEDEWFVIISTKSAMELAQGGTSSPKSSLVDNGW